MKMREIAVIAGGAILFASSAVVIMLLALIF